MTKEFKVLAECVDIRTGNRFRPGDVFDPTPTEVQAKRLVAAGCLPEGAIALGKKADEDAEKQAEALAAAQAIDAKKAAALAAATDDVTLAKGVLAEAEVAAQATTTDEDKAKTGKALAAAQAGLKKAEDALAKLAN